MNLISMTDFVLEYSNTHKATKMEFHSLARNYAKFLKQLLELWMFVPCDDEGNIIESKFYPASMSFAVEAEAYFSKYQQAKERCLFEGFELIIKPNGNRYIQKNETIIFYNTENDNGVWRVNRKFISIEDLVPFKLLLTPTAQKQLGL